MSKSTQWVKPPAIGASGSCMISANDFVFAGASVHASAGEGFVWPASQVYLLGIDPPSLKAGLVRLKAAAAINTPAIMTRLLVHSHWSARVGSTAAARRAGMTLATSATPMSVMTTAAIVKGSVGLTLNN